MIINLARVVMPINGVNPLAGSAIPRMLANYILIQLILSLRIEILYPVFPDLEAYEYYLKGRSRYDWHKYLEDEENIVLYRNMPQVFI